MPKIRNARGPYWVALEQREREIIQGALDAAKGNRSAAAKLLCIDRWFMVKRMRHLGIDDKVETGPTHWLLDAAGNGVP